MIENAEAAVARVSLAIEGLGIIVYSPAQASHIPEGEDYLQTHYSSGPQVQEHVQAGSIVGFGTGSPGTFRVRVFARKPTDEELDACEFKLRLGVRVSDGVVCFRDLYDLLEWHSECPSHQQVRIASGVYELTLTTNLPASGLLGDDQLISAYFLLQDRMPVLETQGVPVLCW